MSPNTKGNFLSSFRQALQRSIEAAASRRRTIRSRERSRLLIILSVLVLSIWCSVASAAVGPTLEADCGTGATIVGSNSAGKVTLGEGVATCTLDFSTQWPNPPACTAVNETNGGGNPQTVGTKTTSGTLVLGGYYPWVAHDVVSYICLGY
jgi:hypothetical protein